MWVCTNLSCDYFEHTNTHGLVCLHLSKTQNTHLGILGKVCLVRKLRKNMQSKATILISTATRRKTLPFSLVVRTGTFLRQKLKLRNNERKI